MNSESFKRMRDATERESAAKVGARSAATLAVIRMMGRLSASLGGDKLRGLPNLGRSREPFKAVRVSTKKCDEPLPRPPRDGKTPGRKVLCINMSGILVMANYLPDLTVQIGHVSSADIKAEHCEDIAEAVAVAISMHLEGCNASAKRYSKMKNLSDRIMSALEGEE